MTGRGSGLLARLRESRTSDSGAVAVLVAILTPVLIGFAALAVDVGRWYVEGVRLQKVADAAALAGVPYMPQEFDDKAKPLALAMAAQNGYPDGGNGGRVVVAVSRVSLPSQLRVTVTNTIPNTFGTIFGFGTQSITRTAVADYNGPAPMGSPCNTFGNEPAGTSGAPPINSQLPSPGFSNCSSNPQFWASIHGPEVYKTQGDQFDTRVCAGNESDCSGTTNNEFIDDGYFLVVKVVNPALTGPIRLQIYDPAYVATGSECGDLPNMPRNNMNQYASTDALTRYDNAPNSFCTGDNDNQGQRRGSAVPTITSFGLRSPTDTLDPMQASPYPGCTQKQYPGYATPTATQLTQNGNNGNPNASYTPANPNYVPALAQVFHQWVDFCTITNPVAGQYYLQVRSNVRLGGNMFTQAGDDPSVLGNGSNRFAVRAISSNGTQVSVAGWQRMPIFANSTAASSTFNLIRVLPGAAGKRIKFTFFDVGDAASNGTVSVLPPVDATTGVAPSTTPLNALTNCTGEGKQTGALPNCRITGIQNSNGWNGQSQTIYVPVPATYSCNYASNGGCWFRVNIAFGSGSVTDATTWSASVEGDPVRIVQ